MSTLIVDKHRVNVHQVHYINVSENNILTYLAHARLSLQAVEVYGKFYFMTSI